MGGLRSTRRPSQDGCCSLRSPPGRHHPVMPACFVYGRRGGQLNHVQDLEPDVARGARCGCVCPGCGRARVAHLGDANSWHFQHEAVDVACNPQPMTLLHAFVRDELARRATLRVPGETLHLALEERGRSFRESLAVPDGELQILFAAAARRLGPARSGPHHVGRPGRRHRGAQDPCGRPRQARPAAAGVLGGHRARRVRSACLRCHARPAGGSTP